MSLTNPIRHLTDGIIQNVAQKFLSSLLKAVIGIGIAALVALQNLDVQAVLHDAGAENTLVIKLWTAALPLFVAAISALKRAATFKVEKVQS